MEEIGSIRVKSKIEETLRTVVAIYSGTENKKDGKKDSWSDGDNNSGLIISCEALESFLIPCLNIKDLREKFFNGKLLPLETIRKTVKELINREYLFGDPYIDFTQKGEAGPPGSGLEKDLEFVDSAGFMLSTMLDIKRALEIKPDLIPKSDVTKIDKQIVKALTFLKDSHVGKDRGWSYTNSPDETEKLDFLYFTWSAVEGIEPALSEENEKFLSVEAKKLLEEMREHFYSSRTWIENTFLGGYPEGENLNLQGQLIDFGGGDTSLFYNLYAIVILHLTKSQKKEEINKGLNMILDLLTEKKVKRSVTDPEGFRFNIEGVLVEKHDKRYYDRCFIALLLKALVLQAKENPSLVDNILPTIREWETELYKNQNSRIPSVWDNTSRGYSIFYTQRAIESLTYLCSLYVEIEKPPSLPTKEVILSQFVALITDEVMAEAQKSIEEIESRVESQDSKLVGLKEKEVERLLSNESFVHDFASKLRESEPFKQIFSELIEMKEKETERLLDNESFIQDIASKIDQFKKIHKAEAVTEEFRKAAGEK